LLLRAAVGPLDVAASSWREAEALLDLDAIAGAEYDAVCLAGSRVSRLDTQIADHARITGIARHAWAENQTVFASFADDLPRVLTGRWATLAHLPAGWVLPGGATPRPTRCSTPTVSATLFGRSVVVPSVAAQLVDVLVARRWVDAACLLSLAPPSEVEVEALRRRRGVAVGDALELLASLLGTAAGPSPPPTIRVGRSAAARERFWTSGFAIISSIRLRARRARST
jgi:hypothetical protein